MSFNRRFIWVIIKCIISLFGLYFTMYSIHPIIPTEYKLTFVFFTLFSILFGYNMNQLDNIKD